MQTINGTSSYGVTLKVFLAERCIVLLGYNNEVYCIRYRSFISDKKDFSVFGLLKKKNKILLGIDISSSAVKVIGLDYSQGKYRVTAFASEALPAGAIVEDDIQDAEAVGSTIRKAVKRSRSKCESVAIAVSGAAVITKTLSMDASLSDSEMESQIIQEADKYIPYPLDEVAIDFEVQSLKANNPELADVLLAACRKESVGIREDVLEIAGLNAAVIDVESLVMERSFKLLVGQLSLSDKKHTVAVVDIGAANTTLYVLQDNKIIYVRRQAFGGKQLTDEIERHYELSAIDAEKAKISGSLPNDYEAVVLGPFRESVIQQISRSLQFFYSSSKLNDVDAIILAGGTSCLKGLPEFVQKNIGINTLLANPFLNMSVSKAVNSKELSQEAAGLMIACGLAMRGFD
ncbi:MAG: pilus assembly protein PilM [Candidatus Endonucleobacter sp. (ex Gigantidas childressi)]|nr:pilus assembly protein PilM [Candidatus Endonucleobacter sp. (ex Gigantidas childressi)]